MKTTSDAALRRENEELKAELARLTALRDDSRELRRLQSEVDRLRSSTFVNDEKDEAIDQVFNQMQQEITELRNRCDGYHLAFCEAQRKLNRLRDLYTEKILPRMKERQVEPAAAPSAKETPPTSTKRQQPVTNAYRLRYKQAAVKPPMQR
eukprot:TRINITY_DN14091_c0_g1_i1.p1 TRINITY_DN14091_c0_g1~~TRINITY_DN14091_c0_g1_i1.p1  ORF type:complete len:165 (+),score=38.15 TRINITY_DN14091_c0_g1_i1:43-495(+)